jgi:hypothetical protein
MAAELAESKAVEDLGAEGPATASAEEAPAAPAPAPARQNLYFVRVPRPHVDDAPVKELQTKLSAVLAKLKEYNAKLAAKRVSVAADTGQARQWAAGSVRSRVALVLPAQRSC